MDTRQRMSALALTFPTLAERFGGPPPGIAPWNAGDLEAWAQGPDPGRGARAACRFLLSVWDPHHAWKCGRWTLADLGTWDDRHRKAALAWLTAPWWP